MTLAQVKITKVELSEDLEGTITFQVRNKEFSAYCYGESFTIGEEITVELHHLDYDLEDKVIFAENSNKELKIEKANNQDWNYYCYGKIVSINPIIADFGDLKLDLGNWSTDEKVIGSYIYWNIDRLDISRAN